MIKTYYKQQVMKSLYFKLPMTFCSLVQDTEGGIKKPLKNNLKKFLLLLSKAQGDQ